MARLQATLGKALLREDAGFHPIQSPEASFRRYEVLRQSQGASEAVNLVLVAATRFLAAHLPTARSANQTFQIAAPLNRKEKVFEE